MSSQDNSGDNNQNKPSLNNENSNKNSLPADDKKREGVADKPELKGNKKNDREQTPEEKAQSLRLELSETIEQIKALDPELLKDPNFVNETDMNKRVGILQSHITVKRFLERLDNVEQERIFAEIKRERDLMEAIMREERIRRGEEPEVIPGRFSIFKPAPPPPGQDSSFPLPPKKP